jgi:hypothetical protein
LDSSGAAPFKTCMACQAAAACEGSSRRGAVPTTVETAPLAAAHLGWRAAANQEAPAPLLTSSCPSNQVARTAAVFNVDELVIIDDTPQRKDSTVGAGESGHTRACRAASSRRPPVRLLNWHMA